MEKKDLEKRIEELEFRISFLEKYIEQEGVLMLKNDKSVMNALKLEVLNDLKKRGVIQLDIKDFLGKAMYRND